MTTRAIIDGQMSTNIFLSGAAEVAQDIQTRLLLFYGEAFLQNSEGTPWIQTILGRGSATQFDKEAAIKAVILQTNGVDKLTQFSLVLVGRKFETTATVIAFGETTTIEVTI